MRPRPRLLAVAAATLALTACGSHNASAPAPAPTATASAPPTTTAPPVSPPPMTLTIYPVRGGAVHPEVAHVPRTSAVARAALGALGLGGASVSIANGTATVDLPDATAAQVAEIVFTLTQFPSVSRVDVGGRTGLTRADVAGYAPLILIDGPAANASVPAEIRVRGSAEVFEATLVVELVRDGAVLEKKTVTASAGAPERGTFETVLHAPSAGPATVVAYAPSAEDGSHQHEVDVPVTVAQ